MTKIEKNDLENVRILNKELKSQNLTSIRIKKKDYEIELSNNIQVIDKKIQKNANQINPETSKEILEDDSKSKKENIVSSPMVGVAYLSPDPSSPVFISEGQHVKQGDILILIEAMKTFNEIKSPKSGVIKKILVLNSQPVEYGETLVIFE